MIITKYTTRTYDCCYKLIVDEEYLTNLNNYFHEHVLEPEVKDINFTADDIKAIIGYDASNVPNEWVNKEYTFKYGLGVCKETIFDWVYDTVTEDIYDCWDNEECINETGSETYFE